MSEDDDKKISNWFDILDKEDQASRHRYLISELLWRFDKLAIHPPCFVTEMTFGSRLLLMELEVLHKRMLDAGLMIPPRNFRVPVDGHDRLLKALEWFENTRDERQQMLDSLNEIDRDGFVEHGAMWLFRMSIRADKRKAQGEQEPTDADA